MYSKDTQVYINTHIYILFHIIFHYGLIQGTFSQSHLCKRTSVRYFLSLRQQMEIRRNLFHFGFQSVSRTYQTH